jgi:hypothetical protein
MMKEMSMDGAAQQFQEQQLFEYHMYNLERPTTLKNNQTKQIELLSAAAIPCNKELIAYSNDWYYRDVQAAEVPEPVKVVVSFKNSTVSNLGMPLPAGIMRLYKRDNQGMQQFIGEDRINHTPQNEDVRLTLGEAFDVVVTRTQTDFKRTSRLLKQQAESAWKLTVRNRKKEPVTITLIEQLYGSWEILENSHAYHKRDAFSVAFTVTIKPDETETVSYRVVVTE